jgi:GTP-binding protein
VGDEDRIVAKKALKSKKPVIPLTNKADLKESLPTEEFRRLGIKDIIRTSAEHSQGILDVLDKLADLLPAKTEQVTTDPLPVAETETPEENEEEILPDNDSETSVATDDEPTKTTEEL